MHHVRFHFPSLFEFGMFSLSSPHSPRFGPLGVNHLHSQLLGSSEVQNDEEVLDIEIVPSDIHMYRMQCTEHKMKTTSPSLHLVLTITISRPTPCSSNLFHPSRASIWNQISTLDFTSRRLSLSVGTYLDREVERVDSGEVRGRSPSPRGGFDASASLGNILHMSFVLSSSVFRGFMMCDLLSPYGCIALWSLARWRIDDIQWTSNGDVTLQSPSRDGLQSFTLSTRCSEMWREILPLVYRGLDWKMEEREEREMSWRYGNIFMK